MNTPIRLLTFALTLLLAPSVRAIGIFALTNDNRLLLIDSEVPSRVASVQPVTGLDTGDNLVGIDVRPATGQLYALSGDGTLYTIEQTTAAATKVADLAPAAGDSFTTLSGTNFGIDFNPVADRLRVVSDADQNLRINPTTGIVITDTPLAYSPAPDRNAGANPNVSDVAYTNNFLQTAVPTTPVTTLFAIDDTTLDIVTIGGTNGAPSPNTGTLISPVDPQPRFGDVLATHAGFDIAPDGTAYIVGVHPGPHFVLVAGNLTTGAADSHGQIGDGTIAIRDIAVATTVSFSLQDYAISEDTGGGTATITVKREGFINVPTPLSVRFTTHSATAFAGSDYISASGTLAFPVKLVTNSTETTDTLTFQVPIINDVFPEEDEFLDLFLTDLTTGQGVVGFPSTARLRINISDRMDTVGPQVLFIGLTGPSRGISGAVLHFAEDMDEASVENLANYKLTVFPKRGKPQAKSFTSAEYDPVSRRVKIALTPIQQTDFKRMSLAVNGKAGGVTDLAGNLLDGDRKGGPGGNAVQVFQVFSGTTVSFNDRDGDRASITIAEGGQLDGVRPLGGPITQLTQFWILDPIALRTTLSGTVRPRGDGIVVIAEIIGLDKSEFTPLVTNPAFRVNRLTFGTNATGALDLNDL